MVALRIIRLSRVLTRVAGQDQPVILGPDRGPAVAGKSEQAAGHFPEGSAAVGRFQQDAVLVGPVGHVVGRRHVHGGQLPDRLKVLARQGSPLDSGGREDVIRVVGIHGVGGLGGVLVDDGGISPGLSPVPGANHHVADAGPGLILLMPVRPIVVAHAEGKEDGSIRPFYEVGVAPRSLHHRIGVRLGVGSEAAVVDLPGLPGPAAVRGFREKDPPVFVFHGLAVDRVGRDGLMEQPETAVPGGVKACRVLAGRGLGEFDRNRLPGAALILASEEARLRFTGVEPDGSVRSANHVVGIQVGARRREDHLVFDEELDVRQASSLRSSAARQGEGQEHDHGVESSCHELSSPVSGKDGGHKGRLYGPCPAHRVRRGTFPAPPYPPSAVGDRRSMPTLRQGRFSKRQNRPRRIRSFL